MVHRDSENQPIRIWYYLFSQSPQTEIAEGKIAMIPKEEYAANEWFATSSEDTEVKGIYTFSLDWSKASQPTVTVTRAEKADADNPDPGTNGAKYLYFGEGICKKFYDKGNNHYELTTDFVSSWVYERYKFHFKSVSIDFKL